MCYTTCGNCSTYLASYMLQRYIFIALCKFYVTILQQMAHSANGSKSLILTIGTVSIHILTMPIVRITNASDIIALKYIVMFID